MPSKLPIRIKKKIEGKKCCCNKFFEIMIQNPSDSYCTLCVRKEKSSKNLSNGFIQFQTTSTQTETCMDSEKRSLTEIKNILLNVNDTLEAILESLQEKKEFLFNKLHDEFTPYKKTKLFCSKGKIDWFKKKNNQLARKQSYGWPDISRLYYGQPVWLNNYMQKIAHGLAQNDTNIVLFPTSQNWIYTVRPTSCPNINYFQPMGKFFERRKSMECTMRPVSLATTGQGDRRKCPIADEPEEIAENANQHLLQEVQ